MQQIKEKEDIKTFILFLMRNIGYPLEFSLINDIVLQDGFVASFDFTECFAELLETGNIHEIKGEDGEELYEITEQGVLVADTLESDLMSMIKEKSLKSAVRLLSFRKRGAKVRFTSEKISDDDYEATCVITDRGGEIMKISLTLGSYNQLQKIKMNFTEKPEIVYRGVFAVLTGDVNYLIDE
ncbi:MAG: DUF4364 family protein [Clostridia bacterium]|nr:DUF4364 family protein [Clostridia bacterium]